MPTRRLTAAFIRRATATERVEYFDTWQPRPGTWFVFRVSPRRKSFQLVYRINKRKKRYTVGHFPAMDLADAHDEAQRVAGTLLEGGDPARAREAAKASPVFEDFAKRYIREYAKPHKQTWERDQEIIDRDLVPEWGDRQVRAIAKADCRELIRSIAERGPVAANRALALVRRMYNWGAEEDIVEHNPALGIRAQREKARDKVYGEREIRDLWKAYGELPARSRDALRCIAVLAQRPNEVMSMHSDDVEGRWWTIPSDVAKNALAHRVYLPDLAYGIIEPRLGEGWVFPSPRGDGPIETVQKMHERARKAAKVKGQIRDWRRTGASRMASDGVPRYIVARVLNHVEPGVTAVYDRHSYDAEKRDALERWNSMLAAILAG